MGHSGQRGSRSVVGGWFGNWSDDDGNQYTLTMTIHEARLGRLSGEIRWTLTSTLLDELLPKVGRRGTEYVEVTQRGEEPPVRLRGVRLDDPQGILSLAEYDLRVSEDGDRLTGKTKLIPTGEAGRFFARRNLPRTPGTSL